MIEALLVRGLKAGVSSHWTAAFTVLTLTKRHNKHGGVAHPEGLRGSLEEPHRIQLEMWMTALKSWNKKCPPWDLWRPQRIIELQFSYTIQIGERHGGTMDRQVILFNMKTLQAYLMPDYSNMHPRPDDCICHSNLVPCTQEAAVVNCNGIGHFMPRC